ncbi:high nitrogen upregulated cytochrome P450 monooxygenase 2 [Panus rudis PR-1116 ss-1]|nr:high nitrogen upregulated cytochrome P450 monooxygenase 2 [Panus rudis PR-1116 ss-1]
MSSLLPLQDASVAIVASGLVTYYVFKRWEPENTTLVIFLLGLVPIALAKLLVQHDGTLLATPFALAIYYATIFTAMVLYRLSPIHPLAKYPGPTLCKVSIFYPMLLALKGKRHLWIQSLHERYGDVVRIGPNELSIRDSSAIAPLMGTTGLPKGPNWLGRIMSPPTPSVIAIRDPVQHMERRKGWNRAFTSAAVKEYEVPLIRRVKQLAELLLSHKGEPFDLSEAIDYFTYDFMGEMVFGGFTDMLLEGDKHGLWGLIEKGVLAGTVFEYIPWITVHLQKIPAFNNSVQRMRAFGIAKACERHKRGSEKKDLFYYLNRDHESDPEPNPQIIAEGNLAIIAGSDTTSSVLTNIIHKLLSHPDAMKKLQDEIDHYYPPHTDSLDSTHYSQMSYLEAIINEVLRLYPAVLSGSQRAPIPGSGGKLVGQYYIPEGTNVRIHFYSVQRDPRNFNPHPESFWPERWLIAEGKLPAPDNFVHNTAAFIPFSFGPYNCAGKRMAMAEMRMVLCHLMHELQFRFADGYDPGDWEKELEDMFVVKKGRLPVVATPRTHKQ